MILEKIEKTILSFKDFRLVHVVTLGSLNKDKTRKNNVFLSSYKSSKYKDESTLSTLYINSSDYLVFRHNSTREEVYFSYPHLMDLITKLKKIDKLLKKKSDEIFLEQKNGDMLLNADYKGNSKIYGAGKATVYIGFSVFRDTDDEYCGVHMYLNKAENLINLTTDELATLVYIIQGIDLYSSSILLLNTANTFGDDSYKTNSSYNNSYNSSSSKGGKKYIKKGSAE